MFFKGNANYNRNSARVTPYAFCDSNSLDFISSARHNVRARGKLEASLDRFKFRIMNVKDPHQTLRGSCSAVPKPMFARKTLDEVYKIYMRLLGEKNRD